MRCLVCVFLFLSSSVCFAESLDEQILSTSDKSCSIHYLAAKEKKHWTITVDASYCHGGWVQGFANVVVKDVLDRSIETMNGFFHQGYLLAEFVDRLDTFYRFSPQEKMQDFIFKSGEDKELNLEYYTVARSSELKNHYGPFIVCPEKPTLFVVHEPISDFKQSLFQTSLFKKAKEHILKRCPKATALEVLGTSDKPSSEKWILRANLDFASEEITLNYQFPVDKNEIPRPKELRREGGENLLTVPATKEAIEKRLNTKEVIEKQAPMPTSAEENDKKRKSAVDLALLTRVLKNNSEGQVIVYVNQQRLDKTFEVTRPLPLILKTQESLVPGWYLIDGIFQAEGSDVVVQVLSAKLCLKEWCMDEN